MNQEVKKFYEAMTNDEALRLRADKINQQFADKNPDDAEAAEAIIAFATAEGYRFTKEELGAYNESVKIETMQAISEDELAAVVGGADSGTQEKCIRCFNRKLGKTVDCLCVIAGHGQHHDPDYRCVCAVGGGGARCSRGNAMICIAGGLLNPEFSNRY